jgi:hypothetical protein
LRPGDRIVVQNPSDPPLDYYLMTMGGRRLDEINARWSRGRVFVVVNPRHEQTLATVQANQSDVPWAELDVEAQVLGFPSSSVYTFRFPSDR